MQPINKDEKPVAKAEGVVQAPLGSAVDLDNVWMVERREQCRLMNEILNADLELLGI